MGQKLDYMFKISSLQYMKKFKYNISQINSLKQLCSNKIVFVIIHYDILQKMPEKYLLTADVNTDAEIDI